VPALPVPNDMRRTDAAPRTFARTVLSGLQPGALLITGDLVDAKTRLGQGQQWKEEWQVRTAWHHP